MRLALFALLAAILVGCGGEKLSAPGKTSLDLKSVPPEVMKVAKEKLPDVTFTDAYKKANGMYEIRGKEKSGKIREVGIMPDLTVSEIE